jgi:predicted ATPase
VFKHALTQDVAYESLLTSRRQILHEMAGQALETLFVDHLEDAYDRLAYHYARTDNAAKAVEYLTLVAEKAARGYAHIEAVASLKEALVHAEQLPDDERDRCILDLTIRQATSLHCGDAVIMGRAHALLALNGIWAGPLQHSIAHGEQAVVLLEPTTDRF